MCRAKDSAESFGFKVQTREQEKVLQGKTAGRHQQH
jgi:hypothetical protein